MTRTQTATAPGFRRCDLDWLRVIGTGSVFLFHCLKMFDPTDWEVKNAVTSEAVMVPVIFFVQWVMPLFFVLSGASIAYALRTRSPVEFVRERTRRILLPYVTVGLFALIPLQLGVKLASRGELPDLGLPRLYLEYLGSISLVERRFPWLALPQVHLWYLLWLFVFSLLLLPAFLWLRGPVGARALAILAGGLRRPGAILLLGAPAGFVVSLLDPTTPVGDFTGFGGWPLLAYPLFLLLGYVMHAGVCLEHVVERHWLAATALAILTWPPVLLMAQYALAGEGFQFGTCGFLVLCVGRAMNSWFWVVGFLGVASRYLRTSNRPLRFATEACLPFYMVHQPVIVLIGYAISAWPIGIAPKYAFLAVTSFVGTAVSYDLLVRRIGVLRALFGMKGLTGGDSGRPGKSVATVAIAALAALPAAPAVTEEPTRFSGRIEPVVAVVRSADHLSTEDSRAARLGARAKSGSTTSPGVFLELRYRFPGTGTELYGGIPYELGGLHVTAGAKRPLAGAGTLDANLHLAKTAVWKDPFLDGVDREATESHRGTLGLGLAGLLGTPLAVRYTHSRLDVAADEVGERLPDLRRDGAAHSLGLEYALAPWRGTTVTPGLRLARTEAEGRANRASGGGASLAVRHDAGGTIINLCLSTDLAGYDGVHPVFGQRIREANHRALGWVTVQRLLGFEHIFATFFAGHERRQTNVDFLDGRKTFGGATLGYRF